MKRFYPPLIPLEELNVVEFMQHLSFDNRGNNKEYKLEAIALHVSADGPSNIKGIQYPVCYVRWNDLKYLVDPQKVSFKNEMIISFLKPFKIFRMNWTHLCLERFMTLLKFMAAAASITFISSPIVPLR